jgi:hypothetical protein
MAPYSLREAVDANREFDTDVPRIKVHHKTIVAKGARLVVNGYDFFECRFSREDIQGYLFDACIFRNCSFSDTIFRGTLFWNCTFEDCTFGQSELIHVCFRGSQFLNVSLVGVSAEVSIFEGGSFCNVLWGQVSLAGVCFDRCSMVRVSFSESAIDAVFRRCSIGDDCIIDPLAEDSEIDIVPELQGEVHTKMTSPESDPLPKFLVSPGSLRWEQLDALDGLLQKETDEAIFQRFLEENPEVLAVTQALGHHGIYVIPQVSFGNKYLADFMIGQRNSMGFFWTGLEIESPRHSVVKNDGHFTAAVNHAVAQVEDWRSYVRHNRASVQQPRNLGGEGLLQIEPEFDVWVIIGRETPRDTTTPRRERFVATKGNTHIQTWDGFRDRIEECLKKLRRVLR